MATKSSEKTDQTWTLWRKIWGNFYIEWRQVTPKDFRWRWKGANHEIVGTSGSELYTRKADLFRFLKKGFPEQTSSVEVATLANKLSRRPIAQVQKTQNEPTAARKKR